MPSKSSKKPAKLLKAKKSAVVTSTKPSVVGHLINHIALLLDASSSMGGLTDTVIKVTDSLIKRLADLSVGNQETRVSVYTFAGAVDIKCLVHDRDVLRLPSIAGMYRPSGMTALLDASEEALGDLEAIPQKHGDHAFLAYVITDGQENNSVKMNSASFAKRIKGLPENFTLAVFVPDATCLHEAKKHGFPSDNISVWSTTEKGLNEVGETMYKATTNYINNRAAGVRGSKTLFKFDTNNITKAAVKASLEALKNNEYKLLTVWDSCNGAQISDFVKKVTKDDYVKGSAYYQLTKPEIVQANKNLAIKDNRNGRVYTGDAARQLVGLPPHEIKVAPTAHKDFTFFVQSNSHNRKLVGKTDLLLMV